MFCESLWSDLLQVFYQENSCLWEQFSYADIDGLNTNTALHEMIRATFWTLIRYRALCFTKMTQETILRTQMHTHHEVT